MMPEIKKTNVYFGVFFMNAYSRDLQFDVVLPRLKVVSYKQVLLEFSRRAEKHLGISARALFDLLQEKENEATSGVGEGVAIPTLQVRGPQQAFTMLVTLERPVECNAVDNQPVDVVCLVLSPENEGPFHLRRLSRVSRLLKNETLHSKLRDAHDVEAMRALLIDPEGWLLAA